MSVPVHLEYLRINNQSDMMEIDEEFCDEEIEKRQKLAASERGFTIQEHSLYIYGVCTKQPCPHKA